MSQSDQCLTCLHYRGAHTCAAYQDGIPDAIFIGKVDHREPQADDGGIQWEASKIPSLLLDDGEGETISMDGGSDGEQS